MLSNKNHVGALTGKRQLVFEEHLNVGQTSGDQIRAQRRDAAFPRTALTMGWPVSSPDYHLLSDQVGKVMLDGRKTADRLTIKRHKSEPQAARSVSCGWGHVLKRKPVGPQLRS